MRDASSDERYQRRNRTTRPPMQVLCTLGYCSQYAESYLSSKHGTRLKAGTSKYIQYYIQANVDNTEYNDVHRRSARHNRSSPLPERRKMHCVENVLYANSIIQSCAAFQDSCYYQLIKSSTKEYTQKKCPGYGTVQPKIPIPTRISQKVRCTVTGVLQQKTA